MDEQQNDIKQAIQHYFDQPAAELHSELKHTLTTFIRGLESGEIRPSNPVENGWEVNPWVKQGILLLFRHGQRSNMSIHDMMPFYDKDTIPVRSFTDHTNVRIVPGGTAVRSGSYIGNQVIIMPPSYINIGAYVDDGTLVDSHVLVGSCAQIGKNVHLSAGVQIGGVLEPIGSLPVIVEDNVVVGGNSGVFEGVRICQGAVIGSGVNLTRSTPVYDCVNERVIRPDATNSLVIPEKAVVVPGSRPAGSSFAQEHQLQISTPLIIKYRDERTNAATALEEALR
ncbi:MAG: 2,3,4,5-tetrahydropyridine-2,6-dicarboxylate N-succinyltransferase [Calditrichota bacterium]